MSAVPFVPDDGLTPLQRAFQTPDERQGTTVVTPPMTIGAPAGPDPRGVQFDSSGGVVEGATKYPGKPTDINPSINEGDADIRWQDDTGDKAPPAAAARTATPAGLVASTDAEKEQHFQALRSLFGLGPDSPPPAEPVRVNPDANAPPSSPEFKAWLRSSSPEEFQKWMESGGAQAAPPAPTEAAIAKARAALAPPISAGELSQQMAAMPPRQPTPTEQAAAAAERYQAAAGSPLNARERVLMLKAIAEKYGTPAPEEPGFLDTASAGAHALLDPRRQVAREGVAGQAARALNVSRGLIPAPRPAPTPEQKSAVAKFFADAARGAGMIVAPSPPELAKTGIAGHAAGDMNLTANPIRAGREAAVTPAAPAPADDAAARDKRFANALLSLGRK